ncbi:MAG: phosphoribosylamine--glycine ligase, partial [Burkholderiales bacterium]
MKLLVIGAGGREHALAWKLARSPRISRVLVAPGNAGTAREDGLGNVAATSIPELIEVARKEAVGFTVVGPEAPLAEGVVDAFRAEGLRIFGPTQAAARLESSKEFAKAFMQRHGIPTAAHAAFSEAAPAHAYLERRGAPIVIKADGLAAGKGVVVAMAAAEAHAAVDDTLSGKKVGTAGGRIVIEDYLEGEEASFIVLADGRHALPLATSQDHKRLLDGDRGPNTGGMGAYSPAPVVTPTVHARVMREVIQPALAGMEKDGTPYSGFLYAGLMIGRDGGIKVLEFNCRMGDPETQPILMRLKSDLVVLIEHALAGTLDKAETEWDRRIALGVVLAAHGYPDSPRKGDAIHGLPAPDE